MLRNTMPNNKNINSGESALKHLFNQKLLRRISSALHKVHPEIDQMHFNSLMPVLANLEMKPRVRFLRDELKRQLPINFKKALPILMKSIEKGNLTGFELWPYTEFIQTYGLDDVALSLEALKKITPLFTSEWGVRPFIISHPRKTMPFLLKCADDSNEHIRRWASEGSRPRLPWGERLKDFIIDPSPTRAILEKLKFDPELYVRKSVANHLNDIAKDHPELVIQMLKIWQVQAGNLHAKKVEWTIHRALRTLIKKGHPGALAVIGVSTHSQIKRPKLIIKADQLKMGQRLDFEFKISSTSSRAQKIVVDYIIHFAKANKRLSSKVFKLKTFDLPAMKTFPISKRHSIQKMTTRKYYSGRHWIEIQINGKSYGKKHTYALDASCG